MIDNLSGGSTGKKVCNIIGIPQNAASDTLLGELIGADFNVTQKLKAFANVNFLRFQRTEPLEFLLFQSPIHHTIGTDAGIGVEYRPPLSENIVLTGGASALQPGQGFQDIYTSKTLFSLFASAKFTF